MNIEDYGFSFVFTTGILYGETLSISFGEFSLGRLSSLPKDQMDTIYTHIYFNGEFYKSVDWNINPIKLFDYNYLTLIYFGLLKEARVVKGSLCI